MLGNIFKSWVRSEDGVTAVEFSLLFTPFLMLTLGILELAIMFTSASLLEGATSSAARMIRTGELQQAVGDPQTNFENALCEFATVLIDCNDIEVEVQEMTSFSDFGSMGPQYEDGAFQSRGFDAGCADERVLVRTVYEYSMLTPLVGTLLSGGDGVMEFMSTIVLQTEPYDFNGVLCP
jgi:hypothetical protein